MIENQPERHKQNTAASVRSVHRPDAVEQQAAEWLVQQDAADWSEEKQREFERWLGSAPGHASAYRHVRKTWQALGQLIDAPELYDSGLGQRHTPPRQEVPPYPYPAPARPMQAGEGAHVPGGGRAGPGSIRFFRQGSRSTITWFASFGMLMLLAVVFLVLPQGAQNPLIALRADYLTKPGELKAIALPDGSLMELDGNSAIAIGYDGRQRQVRLLHGQAWFHPRPVVPAGGAAGAEERPFVVAADNGHTRALGTQFIVQKKRNAVLVAGIEHQVRVSLDQAAGPVTLLPGQAVQYGADGFGPVVAADVDLAQAWRKGRLVFEHEELRDVVATLNRYSKRPIVLRGGEAVARRSFSGVFPSADPERIIQVMERELGLKSLRTPLAIFIYS
ncbi:DUF4880 domain-containing protein [Corticibacter populi]|uniref:DUF4880 domain-containing protein n=1 Tax=Corticibacter populi TaxID=1550736 RepID=A0A3M6QYA9_9BURK|nr:FecR domain-containing protein [Corticibacter populi]RMX07911.1 DUF4880 domain-containing protein [Corticibacter populi]RZS35150.1 FecR family protein [Corticibacter populi]